MYRACHRGQSAISIKFSFGSWNVLSKLNLAPPSVQSHINVLAFYRRVAGMPEKIHLSSLHNQGFRTWVSKVKDIAEIYNFDIDEPIVVISDVKNKLSKFFMEHWESRMQNLGGFPKLDMYKNIKNGFHFETYLDYIST